MNASVQRILDVFQSFPEKELSTSALVKSVYTKEFKEILQNQSFTNTKLLQRKKAILHRKILYYLNSLVDSQILRVTGEKTHGEKYFSLNITNNEELILKNGNRRIRLHHHQKPELPIGDLGEKKILIKLNGNNWLYQLNSIFVNTDSISSLKELKSTINHFQKLVSDGIGFPKFEKILVKMNKEEINDLINFLNDISDDYNKYFTFNLGFDNFNSSVKLFIENILNLNNNKLNLVFSLNQKTMESSSELLKSILKIIITSKKVIQIKNDSLHQPPYLFTRSGPYTFSQEEWETFQSSRVDNKGLACSQMSFAVDINKTFKDIKDFNQIRDTFHRIARAIFFANSYQRVSMNEFFQPILNLPGNKSKEFFLLSKNYIRLWNYGLKESKELEDLFLPLIKSIKEELNNFCSQEETIYKSCGMPTRFKIAFSYLTREFAKDKFSKSNFERIVIKNIKDLFAQKFINYMKIREKIGKMFDGGDRTRFYREGESNPEKILKELNTILNLYKIPLFCYDFSYSAKQEIKLTEYF